MFLPEQNEKFTIPRKMRSMANVMCTVFIVLYLLNNYEIRTLACAFYIYIDCNKV